SKSKAGYSDFSILQIPGYPSTKHCPHTGKVRVPVIMMEYADMKFTLNRNVCEEYFNGTTRTPYSSDTRFDGYSSVAQYFYDSSNGQLEFEFDLYGPYTATNNHDYYGKASRNISVILSEAVSKADKDINFKQYDSDGNGIVDMVYIMYAGTGANLSGDNNDVWPACYPGNQNISTSDGVRITTIGGANELAGYSKGSPIRAGVGVTVHEMSHGLGLPDLYNTGTPKNPATGLPDYSNCGPEDWDVMDGGENLYNAMWPCLYTAWERDIMGWMKIEELTMPTDITIYPLNDSQGRGKAYRITNPANKNEYYIIENNCVGEWNQYQNGQYGTGLMVYHINSSSTGFAMTPNNTYGKPNITILPADGYIMGLYNSGEKIMYNGVLTTMPEKDSDFRSQYFRPESQGDPYPGAKGVTSVAAFKNYTGTEMVSQYPVTDIIKNADGSVSFKFKGGTIYGDADGNGIVNMSDANLVANYALGRTVEIKNPTAADVDKDGEITMKDAKEIVNIYLSNE
ncbi:MAG: M6 family metalloprotease domain-containing protein, partial [Prevotella sp.]|nr:M6 family metalloprotease domain-containing protein [Candidatus Prevotella equi]